MTAYSATKAMQLSLAKSLANMTKGTAVTYLEHDFTRVNEDTFSASVRFELGN
jgi:hypothetical protein